MAKVRLVAIGASAGGLESLRRLVHGLPADLPAAVAVVLHLSPTSRSLLADILTRSGPLAAHQAVDGEKVLPGQIYVARPDRHLVVEGEAFRVVDGSSGHSVRPAIDRLFESAADAFGPDVVGVVLSGSLHDGSIGLRQIKNRGGLAMVQDPHDALYPEMPHSAIAAVDVDVVADCEGLADAITAAVIDAEHVDHDGDASGAATGP